MIMGVRQMVEYYCIDCDQDIYIRHTFKRHQKRGHVVGMVIDAKTKELDIPKPRKRGEDDGKV